MDIIQGYDSSLIEKRPDFNTIVNNDFANETIGKQLIVSSFKLVVKVETAYKLKIRVAYSITPNH